MFAFNNSFKNTATIALLTLGTILVGTEGSLAATFDTSDDGANQSLQHLLDGITSSDEKIDTVNGQSDVELWTYNSARSFTSTLLFEVAGNANFNSFGIYKKGDTSTFLELFSGTDAPSTTGFPTQTWVQFSGEGDSADVKLGSTIIEDFGDTFGFYLNDRKGNFFYTQDALNEQGEQAVVYQGGGDVTLFDDRNFDEDDWIIAFEDLLLNKSDRDYNDFVVHLTDLTASLEIPEPATLFGLGLVAVSGLAFRRRQS